VAWRDRDLTRGSLLASLFILALPLVAQSSGQVVFQLVDLGFVTRLGEDATTAVVVTNQALRQVFFMLVLGASFGAQGLVSRRVGEGRLDAAEHVAGQTVVLGAFASLAIVVVGISLASPWLGALNLSDAVHAIAVDYARWVFALSFGFVFLFLFNAILNGAGDAATPLAVSLVQIAVALLAEWCFVFGRLGAPELGVRGVVLGMATGQAVAIVLALTVLFRGTSRVHLRRHHLVPDWAVMRHIVALSWPPALQMIGGFLVTVFFIRLVGSFGSKAQAAYSVGLRLSMVGPMLAFPLAGACATLVGQNLGAGDARRAWRSLGVGLAAHVALLWSVAAVLILFRTRIMAAYATDPEVIAIGSEMLVYQAGAFAAWAFYFVFLRALQGAGDVAIPMLMSLANSLLLTVPLGIWLSREHGVTGVFAATAIGAAVVTVVTGAWVASGRWARRARAARGTTPTQATGSTPSNDSPAT